MYRTVVFKVEDTEQAKPFLRSLSQAFADSSEFAPGVRITAFSMRDEISEVECLESLAPAVVTLPA